MTPATTIATADRPSTSGAPPMPSRSPASSDPTNAPAPSTSPDATFAAVSSSGEPGDLRQQRREQRTHERHQCHRHHAEGEAEQRRPGQEGERGAGKCDRLSDVRPEQHPRARPAVAEDGGRRRHDDRRHPDREADDARLDRPAVVERDDDEREPGRPLDDGRDQEFALDTADRGVSDDGGERSPDPSARRQGTTVSTAIGGTRPVAGSRSGAPPTMA